MKQIICGAQNIKKDQHVVVVLEGNTITNIKGESIKIKQTKIRGEVSEGMICGEDEIGLSNNHAGIIELNSNDIPGSLVSECLNIRKDFLFEIGLEELPSLPSAFGI